MVKLLKKWRNAVAGAITAVVVVGAYYVGQSVGPSIWSYIVALPALAVILVTAVARVNDISPNKTSKRWQFRRAGLSISAGTAAAFLAVPLANANISWGTVAMLWGFALTWLTTPEMPPWWRWVSGRDQAVSGD